MGKPLLRFIVALTVAFLMVAARAVEWPTLAFTPVTTNRFARPTCIVSADDGSGRLFVAEQAGKIWIVENGKVLPTPLLDLSARVTTAGPEQGLLGLAFPSGFAAKEYFYVYYSVAMHEGNLPFANVVSRFRLTFDKNVAGLRTEEVIMTFPKREDFHNGGQLAFGPDGYLYIGVGDGGPQMDPDNRAQDLKTRFGKILRVDVENGVKPYGIPAKNPFIGNTNALPEIWAYGLRNPWRFSFDRATGDLYIGDVGQWGFEEVDFQSAASLGGQNYGWRIMEGPAKYNVPQGFTNFATFTSPIASYDHLSMGGDGGQGSVTGGFVYHGPNAGRMQGTYIYGDFAARYIWGLKNVDGVWTNCVLRAPDGLSFAMSTFGEDEQGRLYVADYYSGLIYEITDSGQVWKPEFTPSTWTIPTEKLLVTCGTANAEIHYTTDGREPTLSDPTVPADGYVSIEDGVLVSARAFRSDLLPSEVRSARFKFQTAAPVISPISTNWTTTEVFSNSLVTLSCVTPGATIYYTTNGWFPSVTDVSNTLVYTQPLVVTTNLPIIAMAVADRFGTSQVSYANYQLMRPAYPVCSPPGGFVTNGTLVTLTCATPGSDVFYSITVGPSSSPWKRFTTPFAIRPPAMVNVYAVAPGYAPTEGTYIQFFQPRTATPVFDPPSETPDADHFTISCATPGANIYYSLSGTSQLYTGAVTIAKKRVVVTATAYAAGHEPSEVASAVYGRPQLFNPQFEPGIGPLTNGSMISISSWSEVPGMIFRYTTDGSEPNQSSPIYTEPIKFTGPFILKAAAEAPGYAPGYPDYVTSTAYGEAKYERTLVTTWAGSTNAGSVDGPRLGARFTWPSDICIDSQGNLIVMDSADVRKISADGTVSTLARGLGYGGRICVDADDNVYVADSWDCNRVWKISPQGDVSVFAQISQCNPGYAPPFRISGITAGADGSLYFGADSFIGKITPDGNVLNAGGGEVRDWGSVVSLVAGAATNIYFGTGGSLWVLRPDGHLERLAGSTNALSDGNLSTAGLSISAMTRGANGDFFFIDGGRIRRISGDQVTTLAGSGFIYGMTNYRNGAGENARLSPMGLCVDASGDVYVADANNHCIRKISKDSFALGISDDWQIANFGKTGIDPEGDADGDGVSNRIEFMTGTNPNGASSFFGVEVVVPANESETLQVKWRTVANKRYQLQFSRDLSEWENFGPEIIGDGGVTTIKDSSPPDPHTHWFYRVVVDF